MIERVEVVGGAGTVIRYGEIVAWAAPSASPALISFLAQSAQNLAPSRRGGRQMADHIAGVLNDRDPEPQVAFAVIGPSDHGWASLLHGPVQLWDGARWLAPMPVPGWIQAIITPQPTITVTAAGSPTPSVNPDTMLNFEAGVVPGAGLILVPAAVAAGSEGGQPLPWMAGESGEASETGAAEEGPVAAAGPAAAAAAAAGLALAGDDLTTVTPATRVEEAGASVPGSEATTVLPTSGVAPATVILPAAGLGMHAPMPAGEGVEGLAEPEGSGAPVVPVPVPIADPEATVSEPEPTLFEPEPAPAPAPAEAEPGPPAEPPEPEPFAVMPAPGPPAAAAEPEAAGPAPEPEAGPAPASEPEPFAVMPAPEPVMPEPPTTVVPIPVPIPVPGPVAVVPVAEAEPEPAPVPGPPGSVNLRSVAKLAGPPLPLGRGPDRPIPGVPVVAGALCPRGHLNRPGVSVCVRCATTMPEEVSYTVSGTRPALGCLVADDGAVYRLDRSYVVGSNPTRDPTVGGGLARPLILTQGDVSASHAEVRLNDWDVVLVDRGSAGGTSVFEPGAAEWERLRPYEPRVLLPGTHVAFGQRIVTFMTPWVSGQPAPTGDKAE